MRLKVAILQIHKVEHVNDIFGIDQSDIPSQWHFIKNQILKRKTQKIKRRNVNLNRVFEHNYYQDSCFWDLHKAVKTLTTSQTPISSYSCGTVTLQPKQS